jgi:pimeloyl-ACP methyl ester carboxylesterase
MLDYLGRGPMIRRIQLKSRRILEEVWNAESHSAALELVPRDFSIDDPLVSNGRRGPLLMLDLVHLYKSNVPDLRFEVRRQIVAVNKVVTIWSAKGRYTHRALGRAPLGGVVRLRGVFVATTSRAGGMRILDNHWDCGAFATAIGASATEFASALLQSRDEIRVRSRSDRQGVPLVMFPTLSLPGWIGWKRFIRRYRAKGPVLTFQFLGNRWAFERYGSVATYSVNRETRAVVKALNAAGVAPPFDVVAHSAGGCVALDFALKNQDAIRTLTLIEPALAWVLKDAGTLDEDLRAYLQRRIQLYRPGITDANYARFIQESMAPSERIDPRTSPYWPDVSAYRENMQFRAAIYRHRDRVDRLKSLPFPVLLIKGRFSDRFHHQIIDVLASTIPDTRSIEMRGGHSPHLGQGLAPFIRHLSRFLRQEHAAQR